MNIVVKLTKSRITENREWHDCVKLSCDKGKTLGNKLTIINGETFAVLRFFYIFVP